MKNTVKQMAIIAVVLAVFTFGGFVAGRRDTPSPAGILADTVVIFDTIDVPVPSPVAQIIARHDTVLLPSAYTQGDYARRRDTPSPATILADGSGSIVGAIPDGILPDFAPFNPDSTQVVVPIERKTYQTADYKAVIEGFRPSLVSMEIYRQTRFVDRVQTVKVPDTRRWSFGPAVGYGVTVQNGRIVGVPTVGISVQYSVIKW